MLRLQQELFHLAPDAFARQIGQINLATKFDGLWLNFKFESRGKLRGPQHAQAVLGESLSGDSAQNFVFKVVTAIERIDDFAGQWVLQDRVDREITPAGAFFNGHRRIAFDEKRAMPAPGLALTTRQ